MAGFQRLQEQRDQDVQTYQAGQQWIANEARTAIERLAVQTGQAVDQVGQQTNAASQAAPAAVQAAQTAQAAAPAAAQAAQAAQAAAQQAAAAATAAQGAQGAQGPTPPFAPIKTPTPPKFKGVGKEPKILEWAYQAANYLRAVGLENHEQGVWHITNFLEGDAATWWRLHVDAMEKGLEPRVQNWAQLKLMMVERFQVFNHQVEVRDKYLALRQSSTVAKYINDFRSTVVELANEPMETQVYQFLRGLKPEIQARTRTHKPRTLLEAMDIADEADRAQFHAFSAGATNGSSSAKGKDTSGSAGGPAPMQLGAVHMDPTERDDCFRKGLCFNCKKRGHLSRNCPTRSRREAS